MTTPDTVTAAVQLLAAAGYAEDFVVIDHATPTCVNGHPHASLSVVETYRFEGDSDPGDESVVLGVLCADCGQRGIVVSAYGPNAEPQLIALLDRIERPDT